MNKRLHIMLLLIALLLSGCQLAREDGELSDGEDRLIGVLITLEPLDLYDMDRYPNDHIDKLLENDTLLPNAGDCEGRLYAASTTRAQVGEIPEGTVTDYQYPNDGVVSEFVFEGVDGILFIAPRQTLTETGETYVANVSDEAITNGHMHLTQSDDEERVELIGVLYVAPIDETYTTLYLNPVSQTADGRVYVTRGSGFSLSTDSGTGQICTQTMESTSTSAFNGKETSFTTRIEISIAAMPVPERIAVCQMDAQSALLSRVEYAPDALPERIAPESGADYLVVETYQRDVPGEKRVLREVFDRDDDAFTAFRRRDDGLCVQTHTPIDWQ